MEKSQAGVIGSKVTLAANVSVQTDMQPCCLIRMILQWDFSFRRETGAGQKK